MGAHVARSNPEQRTHADAKSCTLGQVREVAAVSAGRDAAHSARGALPPNLRSQSGENLRLSGQGNPTPHFSIAASVRAPRACAHSRVAVAHMCVSAGASRLGVRQAGHTERALLWFQISTLTATISTLTAIMSTLTAIISTHFAGISTLHCHYQLPYWGRAVMDWAGARAATGGGHS